MELFETIHGRRSIRAFTGEAVKDEDLDAILRAAVAAPSGHNAQMRYFIIVKNKAVQARMREVLVAELLTLAESASQLTIHEEAERLRACPRSWVFFSTAPVVIAVCERILPPDERVRLMRGIGLPEAEVQHRRPLPGLQSVAAAIQNLLLATYALGYGACWMTAPIMAAPELEELLEIRPPFVLRALVPIGRPGHQTRGPGRKPLEQVVRIIP